MKYKGFTFHNNRYIADVFGEISSCNSLFIDQDGKHHALAKYSGDMSIMKCIDVLHEFRDMDTPKTLETQLLDAWFDDGGNGDGWRKQFGFNSKMELNDRFESAKEMKTKLKKYVDYFELNDSFINLAFVNRYAINLIIASKNNNLNNVSKNYLILEDVKQRLLPDT